MKRSFFWAVALAVLSCGSLQAQYMTPGPETFAGEPVPAADGYFLDDGHIWGRVNPDYGGPLTLSAAADVVVLQRSRPDNQPILFDGLLNPILDASDLSTSTAGGGRFNITFFGGNHWDFMAEGMFFGDFESQESVDPSGGVALFFYQGIAVDPVDTVIYRSELDTVEFNLRRRFGPRLALLGGVRYLRLDEELDFSFSSSPDAGYFSQTSNDLWGAQLGVEGVLPANGYLRMFACAKFGVYNNDFGVSAQAVSAGNGTPLRLTSGDDMVAYVGDLNVGLEIQTVPCCTLRFGYQALWLENVALSIDQLNQYNIFTGTGSVAKGDAVYHGGFAGLVFTF